MYWCQILTILLAFSTGTPVILENNAYRDVIVFISENVNEDWQLTENIQVCPCQYLMYSIYYVFNILCIYIYNIYIICSIY